MRPTLQNISSKTVLLNERTSTVFGGEKFRYGFNGSEADDELKGDGNSYTTEFRQYDPRLGKWLSIDPLYAKFPWQSPYVAFDNKPICLNDPKGAASEVANGDGNKKLSQNKNGTRSASNGNGTTTYDAPGFSQVTIPDRAIILGTVKDGNGNGKLDDGKGNQLQASKGDLNSFKIDNVIYTANYSNGKFMGYFDGADNRYQEPKSSIPAKSATVVELSGVSIGDKITVRLGTSTKPVSPKLYSNGWGGNKSAKTYKLGPKLGLLSTVVNVGTDSYGLYDYYYNGNVTNGVNLPEFVGNRSNDLAMGVLMKSPATAPFTMLYVGLETFYPGGFEGAMEKTASSENNNREILGSSFKIHGSCGKW